jgi:hypothetical protein
MASRDIVAHVDSSTPLLQRPRSFASQKKSSSFKARIRLAWLALVLCCGAVLFGYDSGLIGMLVLT